MLTDMYSDVFNVVLKFLTDADAAATSGACAMLSTLVSRALLARRARFEWAWPRLGDRRVLRGLSVLRMVNAHIGADDIVVLAEHVVAKSRVLKELRFCAFDGPAIGDEGAKALVAGVAASGSLATLDLCWKNIGDEGAKALAAGVASSGSLATLYLGGNKIGDEGAKALAEAVAASGSLASLDISYNMIGVEGAKHLAEAIRASGSLAYLKIDGNKIGDDGAKALAAAVAASGSLALKKLAVHFGLSNNAELRAACETKGVKLL